MEYWQMMSSRNEAGGDTAAELSVLCASLLSCFTHTEIRSNNYCLPLEDEADSSCEVNAVWLA